MPGVRVRLEPDERQMVRCRVWVQIGLKSNSEPPDRAKQLGLGLGKGYIRILQFGFQIYIHAASVSMCCVCERERERERAIVDGIFDLELE